LSLLSRGLSEGATFTKKLSLGGQSKTMSSTFGPVLYQSVMIDKDRRADAESHLQASDLIEVIMSLKNHGFDLTQEQRN